LSPFAVDGTASGQTLIVEKNPKRSRHPMIPAVSRAMPCVVGAVLARQIHHLGGIKNILEPWMRARSWFGAIMRMDVRPSSVSDMEVSMTIGLV
jgi:hypothetical protein